MSKPVDKISGILLPVEILAYRAPACFGSVAEDFCVPFGFCQIVLL